MTAQPDEAPSGNEVLADPVPAALRVLSHLPEG